MDILWFIPFISAIIGWLTNFIAIRMLFRPHNPVNLGLFTLQGLIFKRKEILARRIAETVEVHLFNKEDITKSLNSDTSRDFSNLIGQKIETFINERLFAFNPMIAGFLNNELKEKIKEVLVSEIISLIPSIGQKMEDIVEKSIDIENIVYKKINDFDFAKLENIILSIASRELKAIELWGAVLGFCIGCFQVFLISSF